MISCPSQRRQGLCQPTKWTAPLSGDGATLDLFVALFHDAEKITEVGKPDTKRQFQLLRGFLKRALGGVHVEMEESSDAFRAAQQIHEARESLATVRLFLLTDGVVRSLEMEEEPFENIEVRYVVWDLEKFSRLRVGEREVIELDFANDYDGAIPCLKTPPRRANTEPFLPTCRRLSLRASTASTDSDCWSGTSARFSRRKGK